MATVKNAYGKSGTGYNGIFNISMPFSPGTGTDQLQGSTCKASDHAITMPLSIELFLSLSHEAIEFDDTLPHYGTEGGDAPDQQLRIGSLDAKWAEC